METKLGPLGISSGPEYIMYRMSGRQGVRHLHRGLREGSGSNYVVGEQGLG